MIIFTDTSYHNHNLIFSDNQGIEGHVAWESPSNIALIKYWGKKGQQLPQNPSLSFSLKNSLTKTQINYSRKSANGIDFEFYFEGEKKPAFEPKLVAFFEKVLPIFPFLQQIKLTIESSNTFPHSTGIASSASAFSALALCLCSIEQKEFNDLHHPDDFFQKASFVARLGSGSAARSVYGGYVNWGKVDWEMGSSDHFADPYSLGLHEDFKTLHDAIIVVSSKEKKVASTTGHASMDNHAYAHARYAQARTNYLTLSNALDSGDFNTFASIVENEALSLHALMMSAKEGYFLFNAETIRVMESIRQFRQSTGTPVSFTLDAGPNIHIVYPNKTKKEVNDFIANEVIGTRKNIRLINDSIGTGPKQIIR